MKRRKILFFVLFFIGLTVAGSKLKMKLHMPFDVQGYEANKIDFMHYYMGMENWE